MNKEFNRTLGDIYFRNFKEFRNMLKKRKEELKQYSNIYIKDKRIILR